MARGFILWNFGQCRKIEWVVEKGFDFDMTYEEFYGDDYRRLKAAEHHLTQSILQYQRFLEEKKNYSVIEFCRSRIKSPESMAEKLRKRGFPVTAEAALTRVNDALGVQIVCAYFDDIYRTAAWLSRHPDFRVLQVKDYIVHPKSSGYRSYHVILEILSGEGQGMKAEVQIRTVALDYWADLEHQLQYKRQSGAGKPPAADLKQYAEDLFSADLLVQWMRNRVIGDFRYEFRDSIVCQQVQ